MNYYRIALYSKSPTKKHSTILCKRFLFNAIIGLKIQRAYSSINYSLVHSELYMQRETNA